MIDRWFRVLRLPLTFEQFLALPQDRAYKYEYYGGQAVLTPRPKQYHALLDLRSPVVPAEVDAPGPVAVRLLVDGDWGRLPAVFAGAFHRIQPFASLDDATRLEAATGCLDYTRTGGDGPLIGPACFVADGRDDAHPRGAALVTLMPVTDLTGFDTLRWKEPPPPDSLERNLGRPHLTWIFVGPWHDGRGVGTALLAAVVRALRNLGYCELASTFLLGNDSSILWHWRNGFRLLAHPGSWRRLREGPPD